MIAWLPVVLTVVGAPAALLWGRYTHNQHVARLRRIDPELADYTYGPEEPPKV